MSDSQFFFPSDTYISRRKILMKKVPKSKMFLLGNTYSPMNYKDNHYPFRQDSTFLYFLGINLPDLCAVVDSHTGETTLYGDDHTIDMIIWTGNQPSLKELGERCGITQVKPLSALYDDFDSETKCLPAYRGEHSLRYQELFKEGFKEPDMDFVMAVIEQRNIKSDEEIEQLNKAVNITARMHTHTMQHAKAGMKEYQLVGIANAFAWDHNCQFSFPPILSLIHI